MTITLFWITSVLVVSSMVSRYNCETVSELNKNREVQPQQVVEIIKLMLAQKLKSSEVKGFGIQKVPQEDTPNYEILITPNQNLQDLKGSQQIKIFVEAANVNGNEKVPLPDMKARNGDKHTIYDVLPLTIETVGLNIEQYQQPNVPVVKTNNHNINDGLSQKDYESFPSKRQTNWGSIQVARTDGRIQDRQPEMKQIIQPSYVDQNNPYQPISAPKQGERSRTPIYDGDYSSSSQNGKRVSLQTYVNEYATPVEEVGSPQTIPVPKEYKRTYENPFDEGAVYEEVRPGSERRPMVREPEVVRPSNERKPMIRQPEIVKPSNERRSTIREPEKVRPTNERRPTIRETEVVRPSNDRRPTIREPEVSRPSNERRPTYSESEDFRPSESRNPGYNREADERRPTYVREETRPTGERRPAHTEPEEPARYSEYEDVKRPSGDSYGYEELSSSSNRRPTYEQASSSDDYSESRPVREDISSYSGKETTSKGQTDEEDSRPEERRQSQLNKGVVSGFPESHEPDSSHHYSRPLPSEHARAFPASPCLNIFKYEGREPEEDRWYGNIYVTTDVVLKGMRLDITLDKPAELMTNWLAEVKTQNSIQFTLLSLTHSLIPGPAETVRIMVKFNGKLPVPFLKSINLNGRLICPSSPLKTTTKRPVYENPGDLQTRRTTERYQETPKKPISYVDVYETTPKRTTGHNIRTTPVYEEQRKTTRSPSEYPRPNPNGYEESDQNSFNVPTKKPPGRPANSNGKPPAHAAKPAQGSKPTTSHSHGQSSNGKPQSGSNGSQPSSPLIYKPGKSIQCGTTSVQPRPLITHGQLTARGQWPWHAALYKNVGPDLNFFCGGSLINENHVLTAAHCVTQTYTAKPLDENTLIVYLGKYRLTAWSEGGIQSRQVSKIYVHPNYNNTNFKSDIAVLALSNPVEYNDYIRPICLWDRSNTRIEDIEGKDGTIVGWGYDETKKLTEELRQAKMPVVQHKTCIWSYPEFYSQFTSSMTFCAGFKNGTSACNGDSGGGMVFLYKDKSGFERWHIRGIVSISPARNDGRVCDSSHYVVFTDVAQFLPWLDNFV